MTTLMRNGRDRRSENPRSATRAKSACFWLGPLSGSHQGQQPKRLHSKAGYMAAPERFAETSDSPLAPRAPSIHGTSGRTTADQGLEFASGFRGLRTRADDRHGWPPPFMTQTGSGVCIAAIEDDCLIFYSITSSARTRIAGEMVTPIASAVFMLRINSNLVGCSTRRAAPFAPFAIVSINSAARRYMAGKFTP